MTGEIDQVMITQNLQDAGCDCDMIDRFITLLSEGKTEESLKSLAVQRRTLLSAIHADQKRLDILDFLIFSFKKNNRAKKG